MAASEERFTAALARRGFPDADVIRRSSALARCDLALDAHGAATHERVSIWSPGRIEVFGKHTDYAGGRSLLIAVERGFTARAAARDDNSVRVFDAGGPGACETRLDGSACAPDGDWSNYVATVARRVARNFPDARRGVDIVFESDLPVAAGVSSSSALLIAVFSALASVNRLRDTDIWRESLSTLPLLAGYLGAMENGLSFGALAGERGVGTLGGSQDQTAILCAESGHIVDFGWMPVRRLGGYQLPATHCFVVASSGVLAEKSAGAREQYNRASRMVTHLVTAWNGATNRSDPSLAAAIDSAPGAADVLRNLLESNATAEFSADALRHRLDQFLLETYTLIPTAAAAIAAQHWSALGEIAARSQAAADSCLGNQIPETRALVRIAREQGALAASAFGAGFGGSVWALVRRELAVTFTDAWASSYRGEFPVAASLAMFFTTSAGPAAACWADDPTAD